MTARRCAAKWFLRRPPSRKGADFSPETQVSFGNSGDFERAKPFALALWVGPPDNVAVKILQKRDAGEHWQGWEVADDKPVYQGQRQASGALHRAPGQPLAG